MCTLIILSFGCKHRGYCTLCREWSQLRCYTHAETLGVIGKPKLYTVNETDMTDWKKKGSQFWLINLLAQTCLFAAWWPSKVKLTWNQSHNGLHQFSVYITVSFPTLYNLHIFVSKTCKWLILLRCLIKCSCSNMGNINSHRPGK